MTNEQSIEATLPVFNGKPFQARAIAGIIRAQGTYISDKEAATILNKLVKTGKISNGQFKGYYVA